MDLDARHREALRRSLAPLLQAPGAPVRVVDEHALDVLADSVAHCEFAAFGLRLRLRPAQRPPAHRDPPHPSAFLAHLFHTCQIWNRWVARAATWRSATVRRPDVGQRAPAAASRLVAPRSLRAPPRLSPVRSLEGGHGRLAARHGLRDGAWEHGREVGRRDLVLVINIVIVIVVIFIVSPAQSRGPRSASELHARFEREGVFFRSRAWSLARP